MCFSERCCGFSFEQNMVLSWDTLQFCISSNSWNTNSMTSFHYKHFLSFSWCFVLTINDSRYMIKITSYYNGKYHEEIKRSIWTQMSSSITRDSSRRLYFYWRPPSNISSFPIGIFSCSKAAWQIKKHMKYVVVVVPSPYRSLCDIYIPHLPPRRNLIHLVVSERCRDTLVYFNFTRYNKLKKNMEGIRFLSKKLCLLLLLLSLLLVVVLEVNLRVISNILFLTTFWAHLLWAEIADNKRCRTEGHAVCSQRTHH